MPSSFYANITAIVAILGILFTFIAASASLFAELKLLRQALEAIKQQIGEIGNSTAKRLDDFEARLRVLEHRP